MWTKPYGMPEGFLIGGGLLVVGLMLELSVGPIVWDAFRWPVNGIMMAALVILVAAIHLLRKRVHVLQFIGTYKAAIPALVYAVVLTIVMGLTQQNNLSSGPAPMVEGSMWINYMLNFWPFVLIYAYLLVILGLVVLRRILNLKISSFSSQYSVLFHLGLFIALAAATLGSADMQRLKMITVVGEPEWRALTQQQEVVEMPIAIQLKKFIMETYDDGKPKRYASDVQILTQSGKNIMTTIDVNKPVEVDGWKIYQYGYDTRMGAMSNTSILELIHDPWLPVVYAGIYMMLAAALWLLLISIPWRGGWHQATNHPKSAVAIAVLIAAAFFCVHHFMPILHSDTLVPALQSPWFKPHIIAYMLAYTMMGAAAVIAAYTLICKKPESYDALTSVNVSLVSIGLALITIGMLFGALWAKEAWGHYWSWDPKETWAAITWLAYLVFLHYQKMPTHKPRLAMCVVIIAFALLQMCWWGINYLPSAQNSSVHVYGINS